MTLPEFSIRRPVTTIAASLLATIAGVIGLVQLPVREYPAIDPPTLSVSTTYPGAAAEIIESQVTEPLEAVINTVAGIKALRSTSREGASTISVEFALDTDLDAAASDVRDQVSRVGRQLPADIDSPILNKSDADSQPIFGLSIKSERRSQLELNAYADSLRERLQTVPGVAGTMQPAEKRYAMRLWIDAQRLRAYGLSPLDVRAAVNRENVELPSGRIEGDAVELAVKTLSRLSTPAEFNDLVIKRSGDRVVRFGDIGRAELGAENERGALKEGNTPIAGLYFRPQAGANQIEIVDELRRRLAQIEREVPDDITVDVAFDNTEYVRRSLLEVERDDSLGIRARSARRVCLLARMAYHVDPGDRDSRVDRRRIRRHGRSGVLHQYPDAARNRALDRPRRGRCDRRDREHLCEARARPHAVRRCRQGDERGVHGGDLDDDRAGRRVPAAAFHGAACRAGCFASSA